MVTLGKLYFQMFDKNLLSIKKKSYCYTAGQQSIVILCKFFSTVWRLPLLIFRSYGQYVKNNCKSATILILIRFYC